MLIIEYFIENGYVNCLEHLRQNGTDFNSRILQCIAKYGQVSVLEWIIFNKVMHYQNKLIVPVAIEHGQFSFVVALYWHNDPFIININDIYNKECHYLHRFRDVHLTDLDYEQVHPCELLCYIVAFYGKFEIFEFLITIVGLQYNLECTLSAAIYSGNLKIIKWLLARNNNYDIATFSNDLLWEALWFMNIEIINSLIDYGCSVANYHYIRVAKGYKHHTKQNDLDLLKYLASKSSLTVPNICCIKAIRHGSLRMLKWLQSIQCIIPIDKVALIAARFGKSHILRWAIVNGASLNKNCL